jgi:hypothetical protein
MKTMTRSIAAFEILFVFPAVLFMTSLVVRSLQPNQYEPAKTAARLVDWFSHHLLLGLYVSLIAMPLMAIALGGLVVLRRWRSDSGLRSDIYGVATAFRRNVAVLLITGATFTAGTILAIVALHMITD